ncbi:MAG: hypothetical protein AUJ92_07260 [Armatimonadetes bacterium CG2_30_59_28]|nr:hypothetical protein [Armatimonadota bacterium]OIO95885.1 MAG: hypothetical protein AUJ92_07260 [Armatimonadetes bacterium CG2_30_59_28]PIU67430.1 MAG: hypothetical protein COS85_00750 [Armatimonadetes bacterium CG07_land_8_20_14_0_80_59_28]PIX41388.1 MAG: hypothetical protein COZ56_12220 [Armatimonadetes bacterium CG_4_8_14_3_um_filter_58_9]PIY48856.1 MAG: hypothetical protein COZ05_01930 [Armatimonadetes bacterium CG_4_10_14_3_um_filter_59_10]PJB68338.1 MAG: hypothetical protein CO095_113
MYAMRSIFIAGMAMLWTSLCHAQTTPPDKERKLSAPSTEPITLRLKLGTPLTALLTLLQTRTGAIIRLDEGAKTYAASYVMPPHLIGEKQFRTVSEALHFLFGSGWEGSRLPEQERTPEKQNYRLARAPFVEQKGPRHWVCNNRAFDWGLEKGTNKGKVVDVALIRRRCGDDGDIVATSPVSMGRIESDFTLRTVLDRLKLKTGIMVNVIGSELVVGTDSKTDASALMRVASIPAALQDELMRPITPGRLLTILAVGLNEHTKREGGDWKWSSTSVPSSEEKPAPLVIHTLRDYAHSHR